MKPRRLNLQHSLAVTLVLLASVIGCSVPAKPAAVQANTALPLATNTLTPGPVPPTRKLTPSPAPPTHTPSATLTPESPTPTAAPTLTTDEERALVSDLLQNNAGCQLPCWWGFTPGKTTWQSAHTSFASLGKITDEYLSRRGTTNYSVDFRIPEHEVQIGQVYIVRDDLIEGIWVRAVMVRNRERIYGDSLFAQDLQRYLPSQLLVTYGQPPEVLLRTFYSVPEGSFIPFNLLIFYPQQGILVRYYGPTERIGERIRICPQRADITLWLWSPEQEMSLEDIAGWGQQFPIEEVPYFRSLEEATGWSIEQFYQAFVQSGDQACFETPADMWRHRAPD